MGSFKGWILNITPLKGLRFVTKGRCNYGVDTVITKNQATQKFYIHFFIDNSNVYISLYTLSCPN